MGGKATSNGRATVDDQPGGRGHESDSKIVKQSGIACPAFKTQGPYGRRLYSNRHERRRGNSLVCRRRRREGPTSVRMAAARRSEIQVGFQYKLVFRLSVFVSYQLSVVRLSVISV